MATRTLLTGGTLVTDTETRQADLLIDGETIAAVGAAPAQDAEVIDVTGMLLLPGGIDPHTHFDLPMFDTVSSDDHYTGHKAAAFGGTTTVIDFAPTPPTGPLRAGLDEWHAKADAKAAVDFSFHMNITRFDRQVLDEIGRLPSDGVTTLKVFTAYNGRLRLHDGEIFQVMRRGAEHGLLTMIHAENGDVIDVLVAEALAAGHTAPEWHALTRPGWGAVEATLRAIALAAQAGSPAYIVHMNMAGEVDQLRYARQRGLPVMGETCPPYLFFTLDDLRRPDGAKWICSPPMRHAADQDGLWRGLTTGVIQTVGTDHCPFFFDGRKPILYEGKPVAIPGKELGARDFTKIPNGLPGVGDRLPVLWTHAVGKGRLTPSQFVALTSTNAARIFGLYPRKGALQPGSDADIVVWDPHRRVHYGVAVAQHRTDYNLYEGWDLEGFPRQVFLRGNLIVDDGRWLGRPGMGRFLHRSPGAPVL
ncbi:MAG TPA: dihydropyrimidinase [Anaerolineales bacterium]|nr:dihydropyrimidinase [Anaerolineales bacterium]